MEQKSNEGAPRVLVQPTPRGRRCALIIVDVQNDFALPTGSLSVGDGEAIIPVINKLRADVGWNVIAASQDWHEMGHVSFYSTHLENPEAALYQPLALASGEKQVMWPDHCVQNSEGAQLHKDLVVDSTDYIVKKGTKLSVDSYSAFFDNDHKSHTELHNILQANNITDVYVCGLAYDYCVGYTALDAADLGYTTFVISDCARGVADDTTQAMKTRLQQAGVNLINSGLLLEKRDDPRQAAAAYLAKHDITQLFEKLCTQLVFHKPEDPNEFLIEKLKALQALPVQNLSRLSLFEAKDYDTMFNMMDPLSSGAISKSQAFKALGDMGILTASTKTSLLQDGKDQYTLEEFRQLAYDASISK